MSRERTKDMSYDELMRLRLQSAGAAGDRLVETELHIRQLESLEQATQVNQKLSTRVYALNWITAFLTAFSAAITFSLWINPEWEGLSSLLKISQ